MNASEELERILSDLKDKTGVEVSLHRTEGKKFSLEYCGGQFDAWMTDADAQRIGLVRYLVQNADLRLLPDRDAYLRNILLGEGSGWYIYRFMTKYNVADAPCYAVELLLPDRLGAEAFSHIEACLADTPHLAVRMDATRIAAVIFSDDVQTPAEFASFLIQSLYEELGVKASAGIGCEGKSFAEISSSYAQAATAIRMSALLKSKGEVHTYREYLLVKMLEDVPQGRLKEYLQQFHVLGAEEIFSDEEMINTAEEFLENSLNISETSRNLYMHRNTLMYRLDKIERATGLNIRKFSDAVTFRVITILCKLLQP